MSSALRRSSLESIFAEKGVCRLKIIHTKTAFSSGGIIWGAVCTGGIDGASKTTTKSSFKKVSVLQVVRSVQSLICWWREFQRGSAATEGALSPQVQYNR